MASRLQHHLLELHQCLPHAGEGGNATKSNVESAGMTADSILGICKNEVSNAELVHATSLLFNKQIGALLFLQKSVALPEFEPSRITLLECLRWFLVEKVCTDYVNRAVIQPHAVEIRNVLLTVFNRNESAKSRYAVFPVLMSVLQLFAGTATGDLLKPQELMERFFKELTISRTPPTVLQYIYHLLGIIAQMYPEMVGNWMHKIFSTYINQLKKQMTSAVNKPNLNIIAGCLHGLGSLLLSYPSPIDEKTTTEMFSYVLKSIDFNEELSRYEIVRAGFQIFSSQSARFKTHVYDEYVRIHASLDKWISSGKGGPEMTNYAYKASDVFLKQIAEVLTAAATLDKQDSNAKSVFKYFMERFSQAILRGGYSRDVAMSVKGYGYFAAPCTFIMNKGEVKQMYNLILPCCERVFFSELELSSATVSHLSSFIEALASIVNQIDDVSDISLHSIENMVVRMVEYFPRLHPSHRFLCYNAIIKIFVAVFQKGVIFKSFLSKIVYHSLLRTCCHAVVDDASSQETLISVDDRDVNTLSYKNYMDLWKNILDAVTLKEFNDIGVSLEDRQRVTVAIYNEIVLSVLAILNRLDFSLSTSTGNERSALLQISTTLDGLRATKPKDFQIFVNVVDFSRILFLERHISLFERWVYKFGLDVIALSVRFPLVSGFYKLLSVCFKICSRTKYFAKFDSSDKLAAFNLFTKYTKEVTVRLQQYKEDLLISCLRLVLSLPNEIVQEQVSVVIPAVVLTFKFGVGYHVLAADGLDALDFWRRSMPANVLQPLYERVLPLLNTYLMTPAGFPDEEQTRVMNVKARRTKGDKKKLAIKIFNKEEIDGDSRSESFRLKSRIVQLLGELGNAVNHSLIDSDVESIARLAIAWDMRKHLRYDVPFVDMKPSIYLDDFLPRVTELALSSTKRQTKVAAAESLHSLVLFMLGSSATKSEVLRKKDPVTKLYVKTFPVLLQLACDADQVVKQLFEPLVMQLVHWFSKNRPHDFEDTEALLNALLDGVINDSDSSLRDFCACCLKEFLIWSIKQTTSNAQRRNPVIAKALLNRIYHLSLHPKSSLRLGAALTFNSIYTVLREEESLVGMFMIEILVNFVESLAISQKDDPHLGTIEQCKEVLNHVERIFVVKSHLFDKGHKTRRLPNGFTEGSLEEVVLWLLKQWGRKETECRLHCMTLVCKLAPHIKGVSSITDYFHRLIADRGMQYLIAQFEGDAVGSREMMCLSSCPQIEVRYGETFHAAAQQWLEVFLASLDCYCWVISNRFIGLSDLFGGGSSLVILRAVEYFLEAFSVENGARKHSAYLHSELSSRVVDAYKKTKCAAILRVMDLILFVSSDTSDFRLEIVDRMLNRTFWQTLIDCILRPLSLGFDMADTEVISKLPKQMTSLLSTLVNKLPEKHTSDFKIVVQENISNSSLSLNLRLLLPTIPEMNLTWVSEVGHVVTGYHILHSAGILMDALGLKDAAAASSFASEVLSTACCMCIERRDGHNHEADVESSRLNVARQLMQLSVALGITVPKMVSIATNPEVVLRASGRGTIRKGDLIFAHFKSEIVSHLVANVPESIEYIMRVCSTPDPMVSAKIIVTVLEQLTTDRQQRLEYGSRVVRTISCDLFNIRELWSSTSDVQRRSMSLLILRKMIIIDSTIATDVGHPGFSFVFDAYVAALVDPQSGLQFKARLLDLLAFFADLPKDQSLVLKRHLASMASNSFPLKSAEFADESVKSAEFKDAFRKILSALVLSGSRLILQFVIELMATESEHVCEDDIRISLATFVEKLPADRHDAILSVPYKLFVDDTHTVDDAVRRCALERVALPLLRHVNKVSLFAFYEKHVRDIMETILAKPLRVSDPKFASQLVSKTGSFRLMELLYTRSTKDEISSAQSAINAAFCRGSATAVGGNELTKELTRAAHNCKKENMCGEADHLEPRRLLHCAAYNTLIEVTKCTATEVKFYTGFLFTENVNKGDYLWDNLVDCRRTYSFEVELKGNFKRNELVSIRRQAASSVAADVDDDGDAGSFPTSFHHLTSQNLADSSLQEDVSLFDDVACPRADVDHSPIPVRERSTDEISISLEMDELNMHECMFTVTCLVRHVANLSPTPPIMDMPPWLKNLHSKMDADATHRNVKLFIAKLVVNNNELFRSYAKWWLHPLMKLITSGSCGTGNNYFVVDLVVTLLSWSDVAVPRDVIEQTAASGVLAYLIRNAHHERPSILQNNLEIIKTLVKCWHKSGLDIPSRIIHEHFADRNRDGNVNIVGIHVLGVVLTNGLPPYTAAIGLERERFFKTLIDNLSFKKKAVYTSAAEVLGLALKYYAGSDNGPGPGSDDFLQQLVSKKLDQLKTDTDRFLSCLYWMHKNHPPIADGYMSRVVYLLPSVHGIFKVQCLQIVHSRLECIDNAFAVMKELDLFRMLSLRNDGQQQLELCLDIVDKMLANLTKEQIGEILTVVAPLSSDHSEPSCRRRAYEILFWVYDTFCAEEEPALPQGDVLLCRNALLKGLMDADDALRVTVSNFWSSPPRLPTSTADRAVAILQTLYSPVSERHFLSYATYLLLQMSYKSPDYKRKVFENPLSDCQFHQYDVDTSWRARHSSMVPLFVETQSVCPDGNMDLDDEDVYGGGKQKWGMLRATQGHLVFSATQDTDRSFDWLTQSTFSGVDASPNTETSSALLFASERPSSGQAKWQQRRFTYNPVDPKFGQSKMPPLATAATADAIDATDTSDALDVFRLRRRFMKDKDSSRARYAVLLARKQQRRERLSRDQKRAREAEVVMYRQYRRGDLPDIEIPHSAIIAPLQVLAQEDDAISKLLFKALFVGILKQVKDDDDVDIFDRTMSRVESGLNRILRETTQFYPPVVSVVQEIGFEYCDGGLKLDVENVTTSAVTSFRQSAAILLLEKIIDGDVDGEKSSARHGRKAKRARRDVHDDDDDDHDDSRCRTLWFKLAELNKSQGNVDVAHGIFAHKIGCHRLIREALEAENKGDYMEALRAYKQIEDGPSQDIDDIEARLLDDSIMKCYDRLSHWGDMESRAVAMLGGGGDGESSSVDLAACWDDLFGQRQCLPHFMRGKLQLVVQGGSESEQVLADFVEAALHDTKHPERRDILENRFSEELALLNIVRGDYNRARVYTSLCVRRFLHDWAATSGLDVVHRRSIILGLQQLAEMINFLDVVSLDDDRLTVAVRRLADRWESNRLDSLVDISVTNDIVTNRRKYSQILEEKLDSGISAMDIDPERMPFGDSKDKLRQSSLAALISCVKGAAMQNNFSIALFRLKECRQLVQKMVGGFHDVHWRHVYVSTHLRRARSQDVSRKVKTLLNVWNQIRKAGSTKNISENPTLLQEHHLLHSEIADSLMVVVAEDVNSIVGDDRKAMIEYLNITREVAPHEMQEIFSESLMKYSRKHLQSAVSSDVGDADSLAKAYLQLARFCDERLLKADCGHGDADLLPESVSDFPSVVLNSILDAMRLGNEEAMQAFPRLLELLVKDYDQVQIFRQKVSEVPCWMFIRWINQMVPLLDKPTAPALQELIKGIASVYPQALFYPFVVSSSEYVFESSPNGRRNAMAVDEIRSILGSHWLNDLFVRALGELHHPMVDYKEFHDEALVLMKAEGKREACQEAYLKIYDKLFVKPLAVCSDDLVPAGRFRKKFAEELCDTVDDLYGEGGSKLRSMSYVEFCENQAKIFYRMKGIELPELLMDYCDWLGSFHSSRFSMELEIPGQYTGLRKPTPEFHTKIAKFDPKVTVLDSIQRPKAITIFGNDCKTYKFLVKGGEDLRLDQRIEQLFQVMNGIYAKDPACAMRQLKLATYHVIPISNRCGLLEWVSNTTTLIDFWKSAFTEGTEISRHKKAKSTVCEWISKRNGIRLDNLGLMYNNLYLHEPKEEVIAKYEEAVSVVPRNLLKTAFFCLSSSLEAFLTLRNHFIVSHAVLCISQYILGIGDRHTSNFLVSLDTGGIVGIDFGHSFGSAIQLLAIPELMPFRLTPQFLSLMSPMRESGLLMSTMMHALSALRQNPTILLQTMAIFIREPSIDWKAAARKLRDQDPNDDVNVSWYPREKIEFARRKLVGHDSREIMAAELDLRKHKGSCHRRYVEVCLGNAGGGAPSCSSDILSVEHQVARLMEHAMDVDILSKTFQGWDPTF